MALVNHLPKVSVVFLVILALTQQIESLTSSMDRTRNLEFSSQDIRIEKDGDYWLEKASNALKGQLQKRQQTNRAKNIILLIGDGMSLTTVTAARIYGGQAAGKNGESSSLSFENFPDIGLAKTYCVNSQVADSACTATAYLTGVKNNRATIGVTANVTKYDCRAEQDTKNHITSILDWAQKANKSTGIVTNTRITHATPAGAYAHSCYRHWESDRDISDSNKAIDQKRACRDIAQQLIRDLPGKNINVILGGGREKLLPSSQEIKRGRSDNIDLIKEWTREKTERNLRNKYVATRSQLVEGNVTETDYLLGLFTDSHFQYALLPGKESQPSLAEMTEAAIRVLSKNEEGYFLLVEGGLIDLAHHANKAHIALHETIEFDMAIRKALELSNASDTLIVVTADHSHTLTHSGYPVRGSSVFGLAGISNVDKMPLPILSYAAGPGYHHTFTRDGLRYPFWDDQIDKNFRFPATFPQQEANHGGEDVPVYAKGPWSHLLTGSYEQNLIPIVMAYAAGIGPGKTPNEISPLNRK
uniref:Alkaline phosphatase n=1 Tax=Nilaparvata lugens TaxID=108931 RepID=A0A2L1IQ96_NILLU|nr:ALP-1 [Nilaparvata lugens]